MQNLNVGGVSRVAAFAAIAIAAGVFSRVVWPAKADAVGAQTAPNVSVACAADQEALVRQVPVGGEMQTAVRCVSVGAPHGLVTGSAPGAAPVYAQPALWTQAPVPTVAAPARAPAPRTATTSRAPVRDKRSWQKTALVIGGSAGAGAGVGGLAGGKKGALIGAAIGGGAATIYEAVKRR